MKKIILTIAITCFATLGFSQEWINGNLRITNPGGYPYGININNTYTGNWAREFSFSKNGAGKLFSLGVYGTDDILNYGYIGGNPTNDLAYYSPWMVFKPNGNVGIGTTIPSSKLIVTYDSGVSGSANTAITADAPGITVNDYSLYLRAKTGSGTVNNLMVVRGDGNIGIGTSTPGAKLQIVNQAQDSNGNTLILGPGGGAQLRLGYNTAYSWIQSHGSKPLHVNELGNNTIFNLSAGNVGIGKTNPYAKLDVATGYVFFDVGNENRVVISDDATDTNADSPKLSFFGRDYSGSHITGPSIQKINEASYGRGRLAIFQHGGADYTSEEEVMSILPNGNVGIGTTNPAYKLDVYGTISATEIKVEAKTADYVFEEDFKLRSLEEVENFVKENKHLPEIASAKEMEENGVYQSKMNQKLLQKIEELTLYMIEQNKETKTMKAQLNKLAKENEELKVKITRLETDK